VGREERRRAYRLAIHPDRWNIIYYYSPGFDMIEGIECFLDICSKERERWGERKGEEQKLEYQK
jgi:hypothetical protein